MDLMYRRWKKFLKEDYDSKWDKQEGAYFPHMTPEMVRESCEDFGRKLAEEGLI